MTRQAIKELDNQIHGLKTQRAHEIDVMQSECDHPHDEILKVDYEGSVFLPTINKPFRVCKSCGYAEEGWGCGYWKLNTCKEVPAISRVKAQRDYVLKFHTQDQMNKARYNK